MNGASMNEFFASFMLQRIENSDLALEDIPVRLARYGLMERMRLSMKCGRARSWRRLMSREAVTK
jgi:hypothetical protein